MEKRYGDQKVLKGVSLEVTPGRVLGLLGPNGAGKTSLIRMVLDLIRPDAGSIEVLGHPPSAGLKDRIGYLPEERGLYPKQRVIDVLAYLVGLSGLSKPEARRRAQGWLERVGLADDARKKVRALSKGMQQKVQVGAAILHAPELIILDEPFTGLDPVNRRLIGEVVRELVARGAGVIVSTHQLDQAQQLCDDVVLIRRGEVILSGTVAGIRERFAGRGVALGTEDPWTPEGAVAAMVEAVVPRPDGTRVVTLADGVDPSAFLAAVLAGGARVHHFSRALPSLEEVFIAAVTGETDLDAERLRAELRAGSPAGALG